MIFTIFLRCQCFIFSTFHESVMDRRTDRPTDIPSDRDARTHLKTKALWQIQSSKPTNCSLRCFVFHCLRCTVSNDLSNVLSSLADSSYTFYSELTAAQGVSPCFPYCLLSQNGFWLDQVSSRMLLWDLRYHHFCWPWLCCDEKKNINFTC